MSLPCVLVVADPPRIAELVASLSEPLPSGPVDVVISSGGDDTIDLFAARKPPVVVVTASLEAGDCKALVDALRGSVPRAGVAVVVVGDDTGPIRTALDALDIEPDRFVPRPLSAKTLRMAVASALDAVVAVMGTAPPVAPAPAATTIGLGVDAARPPAGAREAMRARWAALADAIGDRSDDDGHTPPPVEVTPPVAEVTDEAPPLPPPLVIQPRRTQQQHAAAAPAAPAWSPGNTAELDGEWPHEDAAASGSDVPLREPTLIIREDQSLRDPTAPAAEGSRADTRRPTEPPVLRADTRRASEPPPDAPAPVVPRAGTAEWVIPLRPPANGSRDGIPLPRADEAPLASVAEMPSIARTSTLDDVAQAPDVRPAEVRARAHAVDDIDLDDFDDDLVLGHDPSDGGELAGLHALSDSAINLAPPPRAVDRPTPTPTPPPAAATPAPERPSDRPPERPSNERIGGRDFARQLRAKMAQMSQRLFSGADDASPAASADHAPRHDHHTEIDLSSLGEEPNFDGAVVTEIEARGARAEESRPITAPGSWDTHVRERGVPDAGEIVRGVTDAAMLLAKLFAQRATGRAVFRAGPDVEKIVYFDQGRPVFAASNAPADRMGELLVREGKITAAQYERCQTHVAESGRRMGEILVDFGYLKRRELLPAVRRHVEDIIYSLFGWDRGNYSVAIDTEPSAERIRLSRHPASLILEGIRRKLDRTSLDRLVGSSATVIEIADRERLGGIINLGDLSGEERAALAAFDGQADLAQVARTAGVDVADVLPLAWGLCVLGLATARRTETEVPDESNALVGETDLAIDRERVRARWQLVTEADYFALLGVRRDATTFEIRRAYQGARRDFAADCFPNDLRRELAQELEDIAQVLDEAFRVLRDDRLRLTYLSNLIG
jgi:CheY-like chemotaxis protein